MPIALPNLDDRRWSDLVEQGRALIPLYAPEWTDHNASDPGITLMELLAAVAEMDIYRLNRLTDAQKLRLLALMDVRPEPPRPATLVTELRITSGATPVTLPAGTEFDATRLDSTTVPLRSTGAMDVVAASLRAVQRKDVAGFRNLTAAWTRQEVFAAFGDDPSIGAELYLGFDQPLPAGHWSQLFACIDGEQAGLAERARLVAEAQAGGPLAHHSARIAWEYFADDGAAGAWQPLDVVDDTRAFSLSGTLRLKPGAAMKASLLGRIAQPQCWLRGRLVDGAFDASPRVARLMLNGIELLQSTPVWTAWPIAIGTVVAGTITPGQGSGLRLSLQAGRIVGLSVDASPAAPIFTVLAYEAATATAPGLLTVQGTLAGSGTGEPAQRITLGRRPLVESSLRLFSFEGARYRAWTRVDDFSASARADAHFTLDATTGAIVVGDGEKGRVLPPASQVFAFYEATQPAPAIARLTGLAESPHNRAFLPDATAIGRTAVGTPIALEAAAPAETLAHALGRATLQREARLRAVTTEDFEAIALETPGLRVARAIARPNLYPGLECVNAPGMMTVIVLPSLPLTRPVPSSGFIGQIAARLEARRTIGTRVIVAGPRYLQVAVDAKVQALDGIDKTKLAGQVAQALDAFFDPVTGGPDHTGWPLGRDVYRAEVMQVIDQTPGVDHVLTLELIAQGCAPNCGNVCLRPTWLVASGPHNIEVP
jgi:predicted phage baseplate assembly protein